MSLVARRGRECENENKERDEAVRRPSIRTSLIANRLNLFFACGTFCALSLPSAWLVFLAVSRSQWRT